MCGGASAPRDASATPTSVAAAPRSIEAAPGRSVNCRAGAKFGSTCYGPSPAAVVPIQLPGYRNAEHPSRQIDAPIRQGICAERSPRFQPLQPTADAGRRRQCGRSRMLPCSRRKFDARVRTTIPQRDLEVDHERRRPLSCDVVVTPRRHLLWLLLLFDRGRMKCRWGE